MALETIHDVMLAAGNAAFDVARDTAARIAEDFEEGKHPGMTPADALRMLMGALPRRAEMDAHRDRPSARTCVTCKWCQSSPGLWSPVAAWCSAPAQVGKINPVTGKPISTLSDCSGQRADDIAGTCGPAGLWWEPKE